MDVAGSFQSNRDTGSANPAADIFGDPAWFLDRLDFDRDAAILTRATRETLSDAIFLDARWDRRGMERRTVPLSRLRAYVGPAAPPAVIWHGAFCCSTLIASCLDAPGTCLALKEPMALVDLNRARREGRDAADRRLGAAALSHLGRGFAKAERVVLKPSNGAAALLPDAAAIGAPMLLLYSNCRDFILSVAGGGEDRRAFARALMAERVLGQRSPRWRPEDLFSISDLQVAALLWHTQVGEFRAVARTVGLGQARSLDCDRFLAEPGRALNGIDQFLGLGLGSSRISAIVNGPKLKRYAKQPAMAFDAASRTAEFSVLVAKLGPALDALVDWSYAVCPETPRDDPIGAPLMDLT